MVGSAIMYLVEPIDDLRERLYEQAALWQLAREVRQEALVRLACDALVGGQDSPGVVRLAGMSVQGQDHDFEEAVAAALSDLGVALPAQASTEAQVGAARAMSRLVIGGELSPRELARWAHVRIGHSGASEVQALVELDDAYDTAEYINRQPADLDREILAEARRLLLNG